MANLYPVIMCGGVGSRLWPLSRQSRPKQFIPLLGDKTLFQHAAERVCGVVGFERLVVITGREQSPWVVRQLDVLGIEADVILEPTGRDSAAAVACAAAHVHAFDPTGVVIVVPSDHHIPEIEHFRNDLERAAENALEGNIVTLGITPTEASPAFGYILPENPDEDLGAIARFVEKPDVKTAETYIQQGYLWNCGSFIARADTLISEFNTHAPQILSKVQEGLRTATEAEDGLLLGAPFNEAERQPFDVAVMEKTAVGAVLRSSIQWSDLGAWDAVYKAMAKDSNDNAKMGDAMFHDTSGCAVRVNTGGLAVLSSVKNINVVVEDDVVLVSSIADAHKMKQVVEQLQQAARPELEALPYKMPLQRAVEDMSLWMETAALPLWATAGFDHARGIWSENLDQRARSTLEDVRGRVHGRMTYVFAKALEDGWQGQADIVLSAANTQGQVLFDRQDGLRRSSIDAYGAPVIEEPKLYDQAFTLLALAAQITAHPMSTVAVADGFGEARQAAFISDATPISNSTDQKIAEAEALLDAIEAVFAENGAHGWFFENGPFNHVANPMMHLFEAVMAMCSAVEQAGQNAQRWKNLSAAIADFAKSTLVDAETGCIFEAYDAEWKPIRKPTSEGSLINELEPGHQFEWAWLFVSWANMSGDTSFIAPAHRLFRFGAMGINPQTGAVVNRMNDELRRTTGSGRLWPQAEWVKAALALYEISGDDQRGYYAGHANRALELVTRYLQTPVRGLWFDHLQADGMFDEEPSPASSLYHLVSMLDQMRRTSAMHPEL